MSIPNTTILIIDDDVGVCHTLQGILLASGYAVVTCATGVAGIQTARASGSDLVIIDLALPDISGLDVCRAVRQSSCVPILFLSATDRDHIIAQALDLGADDYLRKPFSPVELCGRANRAHIRRCSSEGTG